jgi:NAD-dependent SIR2 family protein deacetylase
MTENHIDGNAAGGALREVFAVDLTAATGQCSGCAQSLALAEAILYTQSPGLVARCPGCEEVVFRLVRGPDRVWLDMRGLTCVQFELAADS